MTPTNTSRRVFTAITCVMRNTNQAVLALDHELDLLDALLDTSVHLSLPRAAANGSVSLFNRVYDRQAEVDECFRENALGKAMEAAVKRARMAVVERIHALHPHRLPVRLLSAAAEKSDLLMVQWLLAHRADERCTPDSLGYDDNERVRFPACCLFQPFQRALDKRRFHVVKWLLEIDYYDSAHCYCYAGDVAAGANDLSMVQWLHTQQFPGMFTRYALEKAAQRGNSEIVQYLLANLSELFADFEVQNALALLRGYDADGDARSGGVVISTRELDNVGRLRWDAARKGRLDLLQSAWYVMKDASEVRIAINSACTEGHLEGVQWLVDHYKNPCEEHALCTAAHGGYIGILEWIHMRGCGVWSPHVMDRAASSGQLATVQWLHEHRTEGCTTHAMDSAADAGDLAMVQWLTAPKAVRPTRWTVQP